MNNEDFRGKQMRWQKIKSWPMTFVLKDGEKEILKMESKALTGIGFLVTYENKAYELKRKQLPPLDIHMKDVKTEEEIGLGNYHYGMGKPMAIQIKGAKNLILSSVPKNHPFSNSIWKDTPRDVACIIHDETGKVLAGTTYKAGLGRITGTYDVIDPSNSDPDVLLVGALSWLASLLSVQEGNH